MLVREVQGEERSALICRLELEKVSKTPSCTFEICWAGNGGKHRIYSPVAFASSSTMTRYDHSQKVLGADLFAKVQDCRLLMVGAGGIGCELLKNLVMAGFKHIEIVRFVPIQCLWQGRGRPPEELIFDASGRSIWTPLI